MWQPAPEHSGDVRRLRYYLERVRRNVSHFQLLICGYADSAYRDRLLTHLAELGDTAARVDLSAESEFTPTERIVAAAQGQKCLHVIGIDFLLRTDAQRWLGSINLQRETLARRCNNTLLLWWPSSAIVQLSTDAPDFWAWRSTAFDFHALPPPERLSVVPFDSSFSVRNNRELADKQRRRSSVEEYLQRVAGTEEEDARLTANLNLELAEISFALGELERADLEAQNALKLYCGVGNGLGTAQAQGQIADVLQVRGELDLAQDMLKDEVLPIFTKLGDVRSVAVTQGKIADILQLRGEFEAALRIREHEELPIYVKLGDERLVAITKGQIADIMQARGELDAALHIREHEELPVHVKLGDVRETAVTQGKIADILEACGEFDSALQIREHEALPVFVELGDERSVATTKGQIADIRQMRGELEAALNIYEREVLPVFTQLGDKRSKLTSQTNIALLLLERRADGDLARAHTLLDEALAAARAMRVPEAEQIAEIIRKYNLEQRQDSAASQGRL